MKLKKIEIKKMNKKASLMDIIIWIPICFVVLLFLGIWVFGFDLLTEELTSIDSTGSSINISKHAQATFGAVNEPQRNGLHVIAFIIMFTLALSILISNFMIKAHPVFFIAYVFIFVVAIIFSVYVSNAYEDLMGHNVIGPTISGFKGGSWIMLHLPTWVVVIGFAGAIFLFAGIMRDREFGGGVV